MRRPDDDDNALFAVAETTIVVKGIEPHLEAFWARGIAEVDLRPLTDGVLLIPRGPAWREQVLVPGIKLPTDAVTTYENPHLRK